MTITAEQEAQIEQEMNALDKDDLLRPGMAYDEFVGEYSELLAQATEDETILGQTGFDGSLIPKNYGYMEKLAAEHAARINAESFKQESREEFDTRMPEADKDKRLLMAVGRYIVNRTDATDDKKIFDMVRDGHGDVDTLTDNITMASFIKNHKDLAQEVRPGGKAVDESYLAQVEENAMGLLKLRGEAITAGDDAKVQIDRQNRLMTLRIKAQREIKLFAEMAFYDDTERYNQFYASAAKRKANKASTEIVPSEGPAQ